MALTAFLASLYLTTTFALCGSGAPRALARLGPGSEESPLVELRVTKAAFVRGEPIAVTVTVVNDTANDLEFLDDYPTFDWTQPWGDIAFSPRGNSPGLEPLPTKEPFCYDGRWPLQTLHPGTKWQRTVYLQRFVKEPGVGHYDLSYTVKLPIESDERQETAYGPIGVVGDRCMVGRGRLSFRVEASDPKQMEAVIRECESQEGERREESLCLVGDPIVVPHLVGLIDHWYSGGRVRDALERFRLDERTKPLLVHNLTSPDAVTVCRTLEVLGDLKYDIGREEVDRLLKAPDDRIARAIRSYIRVMNEYKRQAS
jgi:hypothetical protein